MNRQPSEVLYYPSIEFYDDSWLKGALCHWDKVFRIVPPSYRPHDSDEVKEAIDAGLLESITLTERDLSETADSFLHFWEEAPFVPAGFEGYEEEPIRLHPEKVDERIRGQLAALAERTDQDGFLSLSKEVANSYMLFLSESVSRRRGIPKLTDDSDMFTVMAYFAHDGNFDEAVYSEERAEVTAALTLASLVPGRMETYRMRDVIQFHMRSQEGRAAFRASVADLIDELKNIKDKAFFDKRIAKFDEDLRGAQASLASALKKGAGDLGYAMLSVGLPMAFTAFGVIGIGADAWTVQAAGQSALLGIVAAIADHTRSRRALWTSREASYWLSMHSAFPSGNCIRLEVPSFHRKFEEFIND
ncbi:MAG: hypothetical protein AB2L11_12315 [Syntrophobacteraceae bacterium]